MKKKFSSDGTMHTTFWRKRFLFLLPLLLFCVPLLQAQKMKIHPGTTVICPAKFEDMHTKVGIPITASKNFKKSIKANATANFVVTYGPGANANPEAKAAFQFALDIWANEIVSSIPIRIFADFANLGSGVLASAGPTYFVSNFPNAPQADIEYPAALANSLAGEILDSSEEYDLVVNLGNSLDWYFGTDGNPGAGQFDFVTVALHEAGHGLGFVTIRSFSEGTGTLRGGSNPAIYSKFMIDGDGNRLLDLPDPSIDLGNAFTGGGLFVDGTFAVAALGGKQPELYAPSNFQIGSSLGHWDESTYPAGNANSLMTPSAGSAESNFNIGDITRGHFKDMGWKLNDADLPPVRVAPTAIKKVLNVGESVQSILVLSNISDATVSFKATKNNDTSFIDFGNTTEFTLASAGTDSLQVSINATGLAKGVYEETITLTVEGSEYDVTVPVTLRVLDGSEVPKISITPTSFNETIEQFTVVTKDLTIENSGDADLTYSITINDSTVLNSFAKRVDKTNEFIAQQGFVNSSIVPSMGTRGFSESINSGFNTVNKLVANLYTTDFELFNIGDVNGQKGWFSRFDNNWTISDANAFKGSLHFRGVSDGMGSTRPSVSLALSPSITATGDEPFMVASAKINIQGTGTTWEFIPQSNTDKTIVTRLRFNPDRSIDVLTSSGNFVAVNTKIPDGYFDLRIVVDKDDSTFSILFDDQLIFSGQGLVGVIEQIALLSNMEKTGATFDIDNLEITDGDANSFFLSVNPITETVPLGTSSVATVKFDARSLDSGIYKATINVASNDTTNSSIKIPVSLTVLSPPTISITPDFLSTAIDVQKDVPLFKTETFTISNTGESLLNFKTSLGTPSVDISSLDMVNYGVGNTSKATIKKAGKINIEAIKRNIKNITNAKTFTDSILYDSGSGIATDFAGFGDTESAISSAIRFDTDRAFTLSAVRNFFRKDAAVDSAIILEIYKGGDTPANGELLSSQAMSQTSVEGVFLLEQLTNPLNFAAGESFWVVHKYPVGTPFSQGIDEEGTPRPNANVFSSDGGVSWNTASENLIILCRALSGGSDSYVTLEPATGSIASGSSIDVTATFDGSKQANGTYKTDILIDSNDPMTPVATVSTTFNVSGQISEIAVSDEFLLFNNVFVGDEVEKIVTITNAGLAELKIDSITSDATDFKVSDENAVITSGDSLNLAVTFTPSSLGSINGIITIASNAPNAETIEIVLNGIGVDPPIAVLNPAKVDETVDARKTITNKVILRNDGKSPLIYSFPNFAASAVLAQPDVKLNNTQHITFKKSLSASDKNYTDTRVGHPVAFNVGKDMGYGYTWIDNDQEGGPIFNFTDITGTGKEVTSKIDVSGNTKTDISFPFFFYGNTYNSLHIHANGFVSFQESTGLDTMNGQIPEEDDVNNIIAAFWDNFNPQSFDGAVHYQDFKDRFIVQWTNMTKSFGGTKDETATFQMVLYADGNIDIFYDDVNAYKLRNISTVGIENADATDGTQVAFNTDYIKDGLALRFIKPQQPLTSFVSNVSKISGVIPAGGSKVLDVTLDATNLNDGTYFDELTVSSNSPDKNNSKTLFELEVIGLPEIEVTPAAIVFDPLFIGLESKTSFTIANTGTKLLEVSAISNDNTDFNVDADIPKKLSPGDSITGTVTFKPSTAGIITDDIKIISTDALGNENLSISLSGVGIRPPIINVSPEAVDLILDEGDKVTKMITISNVGKSTLNYAVSPPLFKTDTITQNVTVEGYERVEFAEITSKEQTDIRKGPKFLNASGGPDAFGYTWTDNNSGGPAYNFMDISTTGTKAEVGFDGDETIALPFAFNFFGEEQDKVIIGANGLLAFSPITAAFGAFLNKQIPDTSNPNNFIAPLWGDLEPENGTGVFYQSTDQYFIVQYENVPGLRLNTTPAPVTFQVILFPDGSFKMQYKNVDSASATTSTVGIEGPNGMSGLQVIFNTEFLTNELAITFTPLISGTVEPGKSVEVPVEISTNGLEAEKSYTADIKISSNDPVTPKTVIPVTLKVLELPEILSYSLINAVTDEIVGVITDGDTININDYGSNNFNIIANVNKAKIKSVVFDYNFQNRFEVSNKAPFTLGGEKEGNFKSIKFPIGRNSLTATPYKEKRGKGKEGIPLTISFRVIDSSLPEIVSFTLVNADTDRTIRELKRGDVLDLSLYPTNSYNIIANRGKQRVGSVVFDFNRIEKFRVQNDAPYAVGGRNGLDFNSLSFPLGKNVITATPYVDKKGRGEKGLPLTIDFKVLNSIDPLDNLIVSRSLGIDGSVARKVTTPNIFPMPIVDMAYFSFGKNNDNTMKASVLNLFGQVIYRPEDVSIDKEGFGSIDMSPVAKGTYILILTGENDTVISKHKLLKK